MKRIPVGDKSFSSTKVNGLVKRSLGWMRHAMCRIETYLCGAKQPRFGSVSLLNRIESLFMGVNLALKMALGQEESLRKPRDLKQKLLPYR